jgi:hypothetical protein
VIFGSNTTIDHPKATLETAPYGINNRGQIVGGYDTPGFIFQGFLLDRGRYKTIAVPGALRSSALKVCTRGWTSPAPWAPAGHQQPRSDRGHLCRCRAQDPRVPARRGRLYTTN